jgi:hypothetical protein
MAISLDKLLVKEKVAADLLLVIACGFSVYTVTYSILEWYYVKALLSARSREIEKKKKSAAHASASKLENGTNAATEYESLQAQDEDFAELITEKFASLNRMRGAARNSMWMSLVCILSAVSIFSSDSFHAAAGESQSMAGMILLLWMDFVLAVGYYFFPDVFYQYLFLLFAAFTVPCAVDALYLKSDYHTITTLMDVFVVLEMFTVPRTVKVFRGTFVEIIKARTEVF